MLRASANIVTCQHRQQWPAGRNGFDDGGDQKLKIKQSLVRQGLRKRDTINKTINPAYVQYLPFL